MQSTYAFITVKEARWSKINHQILIKLLKMFFFGGGAINDYLVKKNSKYVRFNFWTFFYIFIESSSF